MTGIKIVDSFDHSFTLDPTARETLVDLLQRETFCQEVCRQWAGRGDDLPTIRQVEFTQLLFQPVPYTTTATKGMPVEYEQYHDSPDYVVINVPPQFMFEAKIFKPSRLCAIYRLVRD